MRIAVGLGLLASLGICSPVGAREGAAGRPAVQGAPVFPTSHPERHPFGDGREEAARACQSAALDSDRRKCIAIVGRARFFDERAARACARMNFSSGVPGCIDAIAGKRYLPAEVELCSGSSFDSDKIECFRSAGRAYEDYPPYHRRPDLDSYILGKLRGIERNLTAGNVPQALFDLADLIRFVEFGMRGR